MKKYFVILLLLLTLGIWNIAYCQESMMVRFNGQEVNLSTPILVEENATLIPIRNVFEAAGAQVKWNSSDQSILVTKSEENIWLQVNSQKAKIGEREILLDVPVKIVNGNAVLPLTFISEVFSLKYEVDKENNTIIIYDSICGFPLTGKANILVEPKSGLILLEHNAHEKLKVGNVAKIMNLLLIFEAIENKEIALDDVVTISEEASKGQGAQLFMETGDKETVETLVKSITMMGANDSAIAMAEHIAGSKEEFLVLMNKKAKDLGMKDTHFANVVGFDFEDQFTSAYDIGIMARELIVKYPKIFEFTSMKKEKITRKSKELGELTFYLQNLNRLLNSYEGATGLITGYSAGADYCMVGTAEREGFQLIAVTLGTSKSKIRFEETRHMLDYGFENYDVLRMNLK
ncbi:stalk domain-containing protein [Anaeromicrobium sediminis]|nr:stalk domain-containing protein [Anaeromicrobium sediminis]